MFAGMITMFTSVIGIIDMLDHQSAGDALISYSHNVTYLRQ